MMSYRYVSRHQLETLVEQKMKKIRGQKNYMFFFFLFKKKKEKRGLAKGNFSSGQASVHFQQATVVTVYIFVEQGNIVRG